MRKFINRFKEPSSWAGIAVLATMFGAPSGTADAVVQAAAAICAAVAIFAPEKATAK